MDRQSPAEGRRRIEASGSARFSVSQTPPNRCHQTMTEGAEGRYLEDEVLVDALALTVAGLGFLTVEKVVTDGAGLSLVHTLPWTKALDIRLAPLWL